MTIVLQYQFRDLEVSEEGFSVTLSFDDISEKLIVPFPAVVAFADPSVQFGLQFDVKSGEVSDARTNSERTDTDAGPEDAAKGADAEEQDSNKVVSFDSFRRKQT